MALNQTCPLLSIGFLNKTGEFWKSVSKDGYGNGYDQSFLATWKSYLDGVNREIKKFSGAERLQMVRLSRLAFCTLPEVERDFQMERAALFERVDDEGFWKNLVEDKITASIARFSKSAEPSLQPIYKFHIKYLASLPQYQKRDQNVLLLEEVQRANLKVAALAEEIVGTSVYNFRAIADRFQSSLIPQIDFAHRELQALLEVDPIQKGAYQHCCDTVQRLSLQVRGAFIKASEAFLNSFNQADMGSVWKEKQERLMKETMTFLSETLGKVAPSTCKKLLEKESPEVRVKCRLGLCKAIISIKTKLFENNKTIYHLLVARLKEQELPLIKQRAYIKFRNFQLDDSRVREINFWQIFLRNVPNILPMFPVTKLVDGLPFYKGAITPWCKEGDMHGVISNPRLMAIWSSKKRIACLLLVALALRAIHKLGFVYLDLKSANILRKNEDEVFLTDFGAIGEIGSGPYLGGRTTREYTSPEQFSSKWFADTSVDWWSFGLVMVEFLYGIRKNKFLYYRWNEDHFKEPCYFPSMKLRWKEVRDDLIKGLPDENKISSFISRLLSIDPAKRPGDEDVIRELEHIDVTTGEGL